MSSANANGRFVPLLNHRPRGAPRRLLATHAASIEEIAVPNRGEISFPSPPVVSFAPSTLALSALSCSRIHVGRLQRLRVVASVLASHWRSLYGGRAGFRLLLQLVLLRLDACMRIVLHAFDTDLEDIALHLTARLPALRVRFYFQEIAGL